MLEQKSSDNEHIHEPPELLPALPNYSEALVQGRLLSQDRELAMPGVVRGKR